MRHVAPVWSNGAPLTESSVAMGLTVSGSLVELRQRRSGFAVWHPRGSAVGSCCFWLCVSGLFYIISDVCKI